MCKRKKSDLIYAVKKAIQSPTKACWMNSIKGDIAGHFPGPPRPRWRLLQRLWNSWPLQAGECGRETPF